MRRLKTLLLSMPNDTATYTPMYNGKMTVYPADGRAPFGDNDPTYYYVGESGEVGYEISVTHKLASDVPTVTVRIPAALLLGGVGGGNRAAERMAAAFTDAELAYRCGDTQSRVKMCDKDNLNGGVAEMKRLKYYLHNMDNDTATYREMYDGEMTVHLPPKKRFDGTEEERDPETHSDNVYWHGETSVEITSSHKLAKDKPTLTWRIPAETLGIETYTAAAADYCLRAFAPYIDRLNDTLYNRSRPDSENGKYYLYRPGGEVVVRNTSFFSVSMQRDYEYLGGASVLLMDGDELAGRVPRMCLCIRMQVQLPRRKLRRTVQMLCRDLPEAVDEFIAQFDQAELSEALALAEKQAAIRAWLRDSDFCAFVANGSILPRSKGTDLPMECAIPFRSTPEDEIEVCGVRGMGIGKGVTVITGGGYSGKSTLLDAISAGIYDHARGDGRELCITDRTAVTISAEDGRAVSHVNISPFIKWLPGGDTSDFSTDRASGSTSQAANIMEAVDGGARLLLIDEDRSATNFMIRDALMKELIEREPITPFTDRVAELCREKGVSTVLVIGGSGEYLSVADKVYMMDEFVISDVTGRARELCRAHGIGAYDASYDAAKTAANTAASADWGQSRELLSEGFTSYPERQTSERLFVSDLGFISIGDEKIDVRGLHDIVTARQLDALGFMLRYLEITNRDAKPDIEKRIDELYGKIDEEGLDTVWSGYFTTCERFLDLPRKCELMAVISRMRHVKFKKK